MKNHEERHSSVPGGAGRTSDTVEELRAGRRAALNLMEDALVARHRSDELIVKLRNEIAAREETEQRLRESEEKFRILSNTAPALIWFHDPLGNCVSANDRYTEFAGLPMNEIDGQGWQMLLHKDDVEADLADLHSAMADQRPFNHAVRARRFDGEWRWLDSFAQPLYGADGTFLGYVGISLDYTDRKRTEDALRRSEERFRLLSESFDDYAIVTLNILGEIASWNPGAEKMFGYTEGEILGRSGRVLFVPEDRESGMAEREMETARTMGRASDERWHLRKGGESFYASGIMAPLRDGEKLVGFAKIARDLTDQKLIEEELRAHREDLGRIVSGRTAELAEANIALRWEMEERHKSELDRVTLLRRLVTMQEDERRRIARDMHDSLGQQLTALRLKLASLMDEYPGDSRFRENLEHLQELGAKLDAEVNFLVWEIRPTVLDDLGLVAAIENYIREWMAHYGIFAEFHFGRFTVPRLPAEVETSLYRILQEALNNIYKHSQATAANVVLEARRNEVVLIIEDDGRGFDVYEAKPEPQMGSGLGLVGMRERAATVGGSLDVESTPGGGTTVFVRVPTEPSSGEIEAQNWYGAD